MTLITVCVYFRRTTDDVLGKVSNARPQDSGASNQQQQLLQQLSTDVKGPLSILQNDVRALLSRPVHVRCVTLFSHCFLTSAVFVCVVTACTVVDEI